jgi:two-component system, sensor histidine kinase and response regulator
MNSFAYSREELLASVDGDEEVVREVIRLYLDSAPGLISAIGEALRNEDAGAASDAAHSLKGALMMLRAHPAAAVAKEIELASQSGDLRAARVKLPVLDAEAKRLASALSADSRSPRVDGTA